MSLVSKLMNLGAAGAGGSDDYWLSLLGSSQPEEHNAVAVDSSDNIIFTGSRYDGSARKFLNGKYESDGTLSWDNVYGPGGTFSTARGVAVNSSGDIYIAGARGSTNCYLIKYNSSGSLQWEKALDGGSDDEFKAVTVDSSGNVIVAGYTRSDGQGQDDFLIAKYNSSGTLQWDITTGSGNGQTAFGVAVDSNDNIYAAGHSTNSTGGTDWIMVAKYNSSGTYQWNKVLSGYQGYANCVAVDSSDNVIIGCQTQEGAGTYSALVAKYNSSGTLQWKKLLASSGDDRVNAIAVDSNDDIYIAGQTSVSNTDALLAKYTSSGTLEWANYLTGSSSDNFRGLAINSFGTLIAAGYTGSDGQGSDEALILKVPPDGTGSGTYGSLTYGTATHVSDSTSSSTDTTDSTLITAAAVLTDGTTSNTSSAISLTQELIPIVI